MSIEHWLKIIFSYGTIIFVCILVAPVFYAGYYVIRDKFFSKVQTIERTKWGSVLEIELFYAEKKMGYLIAKHTVNALVQMNVIRHLEQERRDEIIHFTSTNNKVISPSINEYKELEKLEYLNHQVENLTYELEKKYQAQERYYDLLLYYKKENKEK